MYKKIIKVVGSLVGAFGFDDSQFLESDSHLLHYPDIMRASLCVPLGISPCSSEESGKKKKKAQAWVPQLSVDFPLNIFYIRCQDNFFPEERNARTHKITKTLYQKPCRSCPICPKIWSAKSVHTHSLFKWKLHKIESPILHFIEQSHTLAFHD